MHELRQIIFLLVLAGCATSAYGSPSRNPRRPTPRSTPTPQPVPPPANLAPPVDCFNQAKHRTFLTDEQATRLCRCQRSARNIDCFVDAKHSTFLTDEQAMRLCAGTHTYYGDLNCLN